MVVTRSVKEIMIHQEFHRQLFQNSVEFLRQEIRE